MGDSQNTIKRFRDMKAIEDIKALINEMMAQEMENFKEAVEHDEEDISMSPGIYTMLQVLLAKIERLPSVWHDVSDEPADGAQCLVISKRKTKDVVTYSGQFFYKGHVVAEPCKMFAMNDIVKWAYIEDLIPKEDEDGKGE